MDFYALSSIGTMASLNPIGVITVAGISAFLYFAISVSEMSE